MNECRLIGRLTSDVELRQVRGDSHVGEFRLAVNEQKYNKQTKSWDDAPPMYIDVSLWGYKAEAAAECLSKGSMVFIEGKLQLDEWEREGQKRSKHKIMAKNVYALEPLRKGGNQEQTQAPKPTSSPTPKATSTGDDDLPF